ncbi:MAG: M15 family metallopeptidase [Anaerolineales bacterium]|nr:M15 family metallopeptidase [Anaerolineales bacterium]
MPERLGPGRGSRVPGLIRWSAWAVVGVAALALILWLSARTVARAQEAASTARAPTLVPVIVAVITQPPPTPAPAVTAPAPAETPSPTATPGSAQSLASEAGCGLYNQIPADLLTLVDRDTALDRDFVPEDLEEVPLDPANLAFRPIPLRQVVHQPLLDMLDAMNQAGLSVWVMSGYRTYGEQQLAYNKWLQLYPDRAADISALPGHSEHQLGTALDFSTPYMDERYGDFFNIRFDQTPEGQWLLRHAKYYGFTLSYPARAVEQTGYAVEPWHFRYVGLLADELAAREITLTEYLRGCRPR